MNQVFAVFFSVKYEGSDLICLCKTRAKAFEKAELYIEQYLPTAMKKPYEDMWSDGKGATVRVQVLRVE